LAHLVQFERVLISCPTDWGRLGPVWLRQWFCMHLDAAGGIPPLRLHNSHIVEFCGIL